jgi:hypothetical protein
LDPDTFRAKVLFYLEGVVWPITTDLMKALGHEPENLVTYAGLCGYKVKIGDGGKSFLAFLGDGVDPLDWFQGHETTRWKLEHYQYELGPRVAHILLWCRSAAIDGQVGWLLLALNLLWDLEQFDKEVLF